MTQMMFTDPEIPEETRNEVNRATAAGRLPQSILLSGGSAALREKCTKELCMAAVCLNVTKDSPFPCKNCSSCRKAASSVHPDIKTLVPADGKKTVSIQNIREQIIADLASAPNEAPNKVFILPDADTLSVVVQNALLKTIEEPPENAMFILLSPQRGSLLTTVISRVTEYSLGDVLSSKSRKEDEKAKTIAAGLIEALVKDDEYGLFMKTAPMLKNRKLASETASVIVTAVRDALCEDSDTENLSGLDKEVFMLASSFDAISLMKIKQAMDKIIADAAANANENLLISRFSSMLAVIQKERRA